MKCVSAGRPTFLQGSGNQSAGDGIIIMPNSETVRNARDIPYVPHGPLTSDGLKDPGCMPIGYDEAVLIVKLVLIATRAALAMLGQQPGNDR